MTEQNEDREEDRGEAPYRPQSPNTSDHGNYSKYILLSLGVAALALVLGLWLGTYHEVTNA